MLFQTILTQSSLSPHFKMGVNRQRPQAALNWLSPLAYECLLSVYAAGKKNRVNTILLWISPVFEPQTISAVHQKLHYIHFQSFIVTFFYALFLKIIIKFCRLFFKHFCNFSSCFQGAYSCPPLLFRSHNLYVKAYVFTVVSETVFHKNLLSG